MDYLSKITSRIFGSIPVAKPISKWIYGFSGSENHYGYMQENKPNFLTEANNASTQNFDKENDHTGSQLSSVYKDEDSSKTDLSVENIDSTDVIDSSTEDKKKPDIYHSSSNSLSTDFGELPVSSRRSIDENPVTTFNKKSLKTDYLADRNGKSRSGIKLKNATIKPLRVEGKFKNRVENVKIFGENISTESTDFGELPVSSRRSLDENPVTTFNKKSLKTDYLADRNGKSRSGIKLKNATIKPLRVEGKFKNRVENVKIFGQNISTDSPDISPSEEIIQTKFVAANVNSSTESAALSPLTTNPVIHTIDSNNISNSERGFSSVKYGAPINKAREGTRTDLLKTKSYPPSGNGLSTNPISKNPKASPIHIDYSQKGDSDVRAFEDTSINFSLLNQLSPKSISKHVGISDRGIVNPNTENGRKKSFSLTNDITPSKKSYSMTTTKIIAPPKNDEASSITLPPVLPAAAAPNTHVKATEFQLPDSETVILGPERLGINKFKDRLKDEQFTIDDKSFSHPKTVEEEVSMGSFRGLTTSSDSTLVERRQEVELPLPPIFEQGRPMSAPGGIPVAKPDREEYNIHVNIGTVEVQSEKSTKSPYPVVSDNPTGPQLSLDEYLELREGA